MYYHITVAEVRADFVQPRLVDIWFIARCDLAAYFFSWLSFLRGLEKAWVGWFRDVDDDMGQPGDATTMTGRKTACVCEVMRLGGTHLVFEVMDSLLRAHCISAGTDQLARAFKGVAECVTFYHHREGHLCF
jgi:hypothetical protein